MKRAFFSLVLAACGGSDEEASTAPICQSYADDTAAMTAYQEVDDDVWEEAEMDLASCSSPAAPDGSLCVFQAQVIDFEDDEFLPVLGGTTVKVFPGNVIDDIDATCSAAGSGGNPVCFEGEADTAGRIDFAGLPCNSKIAVWASKQSSVSPVTKPAAQFDIVVDEHIHDVITISVQTYNLIPGIVGFAPNPELGIVAGQAQDCLDNGVSQVNVNIEEGTLDEPATADFCGTSPIYRVGTFYFVDQFPNKDQKFTSEDGLWSFVNVPPGPVTVFASARRGDGSEVESVGSARLASLPDTITIADIFVTPP